MNIPVRAPGAGHNRSPLAADIERRRTFAIISHPDAGKTTLTEKLLLFGGAIQLAGHVKAKRNRRTTQSDWMAIERERGISVVTSVMTFEYDGRVFNLLDTPGHEDFSEDTYRTLTAVDSAVMVIDAAKGIEARTRKLFEVCRLRDIPIVTFINKMDRESRDPFDLLDEIEKTLALDTTPVNWPVGRGRDFVGTIAVEGGGVRLLEGDAGRAGTLREMSIKEVAALNPNLDEGAIAEEINLVRDACKPFDLTTFREGHLSPVFFGSALKNFGVGDLLDVVGIPNHGAISIGDTLTEGEEINFMGVPNFAPEILRRVRLPDAMKAKKLKEALQQLAEEGVVQVFRPQDGSPALVGVVGPLQLDVLRVRLKDEYGLEVMWDDAEFALARWIAADDPKVLAKFISDNGLSIADDLDGDPVYLARNEFYLGYTRDRSPGIVFTDVKDRHADGKTGID